MLFKKGTTLPKVGDVINNCDIKAIYDIKTTMAGTLSGDQLKRLKLVMSGWDKTLAKDMTVKSINTPERYTSAKGWHTNPKFTTAVKLFSVFAVLSAASNVNAMIHHSDYDQELHDISEQAAKIRAENDPSVRLADKALLLQGPVRNYIEHFIPGQLSDTAINVAVYKILGDD